MRKIPQFHFIKFLVQIKKFYGKKRGGGPDFWQEMEPCLHRTPGGCQREVFSWAGGCESMGQACLCRGTVGGRIDPGSPGHGWQVRKSGHRQNSPKSDHINPKSSGSQVLNVGQKVIRRRATSIPPKRGIRGRRSLVIVVCATLTPTNSRAPTGGVQIPIQRFMLIMIPMWSDTTPSYVTTGRKIGVKIRTAGVMSMNIPTSNRIRLVVRRITILLSLRPSSAELISWGIPSKDITHYILTDVAISSITIAVVEVAFTRISGRSVTLISR